ncbi:MAG: hypothetical protein CW691_10670 [Candidatus Bathyarchaeum sp.]|nr:MAG: hypothetical protein CW691_10670 [Candidatus Bathyarchaeum sp.]
MSVQLNEHLKENILNLCNEIAGSRQITAVCIYGPWVCGYADKKTDLNVLLILDRFTLRLNTYHETIDDFNVSVLTVNRLDFERDIKRGWLGEFFAEKVTFPYEPLKNKEYLQLNELKIKKRTILEILENLIMVFPESSHEFLIEKEYFMYAVMMRRAKLFPPTIYSFLNMTTRTLRQKNVETIMDGYLKALNELETQNTIFYSGYCIKISKNHINAVKKRKLRLAPILKSFQKMTITPLLSVLSESTNSLIQEQRLFTKNHQKINTNELVSQLEDPKKYVLLPTPLGPVSLSDKSDIRDVAKKILPDGELSKMKIKNIGGVLNEVYLLTLTKNGEEQKFVVKQFIDWSNLKWLSLTLWTLGSASFSVLGHSRLEKEYAINKFLQSNGFPVPKIFYISHKKRLIFEEFIEGNELVEPIKRIMYSNETDADLDLVKNAGQKTAQAHSLGVSLGDCKPENFLVANNELVLLDLEQATRDGNPVWDVAEFLYYSGHYSPPISSTKAATLIAQKFIEGYLEAGGKKETIKKAASARYTKVFTVFTPPHVLLAISNICQKIGNT